MISVMPDPTFLVIGAGRSGTTSLHHHLAAHPEVFVPDVKAPSHFYAVDEPGHRRRPETADYFVRERDAYQRLFNGSEGFVARGEVSPAYLCSPRVPERIKRDLPDVRLVAVVRHPTDRFVARFVARHRDGLERATGITEVVERERAAGVDLDDTAGTYLAAGFTSHVLERYLELFGHEALHLVTHDELLRDGDAVMASVFHHLGVDPSIRVDTSTRHNASGGDVPGMLGGVWRSSAGLRRRARPFVPRAWRDAAFRVATRTAVPAQIPEADRALLDEYYTEEVARLGVILGRDLRRGTDRVDR